MGEPIASTYEWTDDDYIEMIVANQRYALSHPIVRFGLRFLSLIVILGGSGAIVGLIVIAPDRPRVLASVVVTVVGLGVLIYLLRANNFLNRIVFRRQLRSIPSESRRIEWGCDEGGLWLRTSTQESTIRWEKFQTIVETPKCFLFYEGKILNTWLPSRAFRSPEVLRGFAALAQAKIPNYVVLGECRFVGQPKPIGADEL
jgi:hypothetical protein